MNKKAITVILAVVAALLVGVTAMAYKSMDRKAPVISFPGGTAAYTDGETDAQLLEGVTATDDKDGDVTKSLRVTSIIVAGNGKSVTVSYAAEDKSHNVATGKRTLTYSGTKTGVIESSGVQETADTATPAEMAAESETTSVAATETAADSTAQTDSADQESAAVAQEEADIAALPAGDPSIRLTQHYVTLTKGSTFDYRTYIASVSDDTDSETTLWQHINVSGKPDMNTPGTYQVTYTVSDKSGNTSNSAVLNVTVQ
jgi:hypothetical protein